MALKKLISLKTNFGDTVVFPYAYIKVNNIIGDKNEMRADVVFLKETGGMIVDNKSYFFPPNLNESNFIAQAYNHLKTLDEFAGAVDC
jgi:hypothetical protein